MASNIKKRTAKIWKYNPNEKIETFDQNNITESNFANQLLIMKKSDVTFSFLMNTFGHFNGSSFANPYDILEVPAEMYWYTDNSAKIHTNKSQFNTTVGIFILNIFLLRDFGFSWLFNGYINKSFNSKMCSKINQQLVYALAEDKIKVSDYYQFLDYVNFLMPFETVLGSNHTEAVLTFPKTIAKKKEELLAKNKDELSKGNIAVSENIEKELINYAEDYLKDDPGIDVFKSGGGGNMANNFKNLYIMKGMVRDPDPNAKQEFNFIGSSFVSGIKAEEYDALANNLALGGYSRSCKTATGGYWEKLFTASLQSVILDEPGTDCGTKEYIEDTITEDNISLYMYNYIIEGDKLIELTSDNKDKYINKKVKMRFIIFCKSKDKICSKCAGNLFYRRNSYNLGLASASVASKIKNTSMKAFHDSTIVTTEIDPMKAFGFKPL